MEVMPGTRICGQMGGYAGNIRPGLAGLSGQRVLARRSGQPVV